MNILIFKTNIRFKRDLRIIRSFLSAYEHVIKWNVDMHDVDKILRVVSATVDPVEIIKTVNNAGYYCEELQD